METTRRNIFRFAAGASAGVVFTPLPWKLLDDVSIWSQNWGWLPRPLRGEITEKLTACTLCPTGCAVKARCVAGQPYRLTGVDRALCPAGIGAHQLPYATGRIRTATLHGDVVTVDKAVAVLQERLSKAAQVAVLDARPWRAASDVYRQIAAANPDRWRHVSTAPIPAYAVDPAKAQVVLSFGAPVLHGWQMPVEYLRNRANYKLIQVEAVQSRTAAFADMWLPIRPRTEGIIAASMAHVMLRDKLAKDPGGIAVLAADFPPARAERLTGVPANQIELAARTFATAACALALGPMAAGSIRPEAASLIANLNHLIGDRAAVSAMPSRAAVADLESVPDHSVDVLFVDGAEPLPPAVIRRKLRPEPTIVALSAFPNEWTRMADVVIPTPAFLEVREDVTEPPDAVRPTLRLAAALLKAPAGVVAAADFVARVAGSDATVEQAIDSRIEAIHTAGKGTVKDQALKAVSLDDFKSALAEGATWQGEAATGRPVWPALPSDADVAVKALIPEPAGSGSTLAVGSPLPPVPLLGKLYQESSLYPATGIVRLSPAAGLVDGQQVQLSSTFGSGRACVKVDPSIPAGVLQTDADAALRLCGGQGSAWRVATVTLVATERSAS